MNASALIDALPRDFTLTLVDVGSAGGVSGRWRAFKPLVSAVLFDPREPEATGSFGRGATRVYPVALGEKPGEANLYLTRMANMSSFLRPEQEVFVRYGKKQADAAVVSIENVPVERLDDLALRDEFRTDVLKVDTQGSELIVLRGAEQALQSAVLAEVEVSFFRRYVGQPLFADVEAFMNERGFELVDLLKLKRYRTANSWGIRNAAVHQGERSGRIAYADAIFLRKEDHILHAAQADAGLTLLRAIVALVAYGKTDIAARLLDEGHDSIDPTLAATIGQALKTLPAQAEVTGILSRLLGKAG